MILHFGFSIQRHASIGTPSILLATRVSRTPSLFIQRHRQRQLLRRSQSNCFCSSKAGEIVLKRSKAQNALARF
jgi:hypothetical protein